MRQSWFSDEGDELLFGRYVERVESWRDAFADGRVTGEEVRAQAERVADLMRELEDTLDDETHARLTNVFVEWAVLQGLQSEQMLEETEKAGEGAR